MGKFVTWTRKSFKKTESLQTIIADGQIIREAALVNLPDNLPHEDPPNSSNRHVSVPVPESMIPLPASPAHEHSLETHDGSSDVPELASLIPLPADDDDEDQSPQDVVNPPTSTESTTSTKGYEHEPFDIFQFRVIALARFHLWPGVKPELISVQRMHGGCFNRVIGLGRGKEQYIVRVPRSEHLSNVLHDVAAIQFAQKNTRIPVPEVIAFDDTSANALGTPYMVQKRLPGVSAFVAYSTLSQEQKRILAFEMGWVYRQMASIGSNYAGHPIFPSGEWSIQIHIAPFQPKNSCQDWLHRDRKPALSVKDLMLSLFEAQTDDNNMIARMIDAEIFRVLVSELAENGWLDDVPNCLAHLDLVPHNIIVNPDSKSHEQVLSAVLDWDSAVLAPAFMACTPPMWLWAWEGNENEDEMRANCEPAAALNRELKGIFETTAGPVYKRFAYAAPYRLARRLMTFAMETHPSVYEVTEAINMCQEWISIMGDQGKVSKLAELPRLKLVKRILELRAMEGSAN